MSIQGYRISTGNGGTSILTGSSKDKQEVGRQGWKGFLWLRALVKIGSTSTCLLRAPAYSWSAKSMRLLALHPTLMWGTTRDGQGCHHLPPTPTDRWEGMQTMITSSLDTMSALSITTLALTPSTTRAIRLEHPSRGRMMIPQANKG